MSLFGKKKEEKKTAACCCCETVPASGSTEINGASDCCGKAVYYLLWPRHSHIAPIILNKKIAIKGYMCRRQDFNGDI